MTDALDTLGKTITENEKRDAIHLAVEPAIAGEVLYPGQHIAIKGGSAIRAPSSEAVGIVDPFLDSRVFPGDRFWLVVYPRTITSLRHVWTHPAFDDAPEPQTEKEISERWLRNYVATNDVPGYEQIVALALVGPADDCDDYLLVRGSNAYADIPPEFWDHIEVVTGQKIPEDRRPSYFSCSC